ncbi:large-conductance mechanosensitive channel protein MscL [Dietzia sp.]|uniref:large-conductance mechanosensitive channel protein MscL n=1 Tax=Dietzia sp. TaxID=1871616 RepID=UPI002FDB2474
MLKGFKEFIMQGNVVDLAVAVVIGGAFTAIVTAFTDGIVNPLVALLGGNSEVGFAYQILDSNPKTTLDFGSVITAAINFLLIAAVIYFVLVLPMNTMKARMAKDEGADAPATDNELLTEIRDLLAGRPLEHPKHPDYDPSDS